MISMGVGFRTPVSKGRASRWLRRGVNGHADSRYGGRPSRFFRGKHALACNRTTSGDDGSPSRSQLSPYPHELSPVSAHALNAILVAHRAFITRRPGGQRANLKFRVLSGLDLTGCQLVEADLSGACLNGCLMVRANLRNANLFGADLTGVDLTEATLADADMRGVAMSDAKLVRTDLTRVDLREGMLMTSCARRNPAIAAAVCHDHGQGPGGRLKARKGAVVELFPAQGESAQLGSEPREPDAGKPCQGRSARLQHAGCGFDRHQPGRCESRRRRFDRRHDLHDQT